MGMKNDRGDDLRIVSDAISSIPVRRIELVIGSAAGFITIGGNMPNRVVMVRRRSGRGYRHVGVLLRNAISVF